MDEKTMLYFRGERRQELLCLPFESSPWSLPVGKVICTLLRLGESFFKNIRTLANEVEAFMKDHPIRRDTSYERENKSAECDIAALRSLIIRHLDQFHDADEAMIAKLAVILPAVDAHVNASSRSDRRLPSKSELEEERRDLLASRDIVIDRTRISNRTDSEAEGWHQWVNYLGVGGEYYMWIVIQPSVYGKYGESYAGLLLEEYYELRKLQAELIRAIVDHDTASRTTLAQMQGPRLVPKTMGDAVFPRLVRGAYKYGDVYGIVSMSELVRAELSLLDDVDREVKRCKLCGRFFVPYRTDANYCSEPNPAYGGQSCSRIGSRIEYGISHAMLQTEAGKAYQKNYKALSRWVIKNMEYTEDSILSLYPDVKLPGESDEKKEARKRRQAITNELTASQDTWRRTAKEALFRYSRGEIGEEECKERIKLPTVYERSPELAKLREDMKAYLRGSIE